MKPPTDEGATATLPDSANLLAPAAPAPELALHTWDDDTGVAINPETVQVDFGGNPGRRAAAVTLASCGDGTWRMCYDYVTKKGAGTAAPLRREGQSFEDRTQALRAGLAKLDNIFKGDGAGREAIARVFDTTWAKDAKDETACSLANTGAVVRFAPLPKPVPAILRVAAVLPNPENARRGWGAAAMNELKESIIGLGGLLQPIAVRRLSAEELGEFSAVNFTSEAHRYEIILGHRRHQAYSELQWPEIPANVYEGVTRAQAKAAALIENLQREDLNPIEQAEGFADLMKTEGLTQEVCALRVGKSRPVVANALRLLKLPEKVIALIRAGHLSVAHGVALARKDFQDWPEIVVAIAETAAEDGLPASELETGLPCVEALFNRDLIVRLDAGKFDWDLPKELRKHPSYFRVSDYAEYLFDPAFYAGFHAQWKTDREAARATQIEKERKQAEKAAKNPAAIKSLQDLPHGSFVEVEKNDALLGLIPADSVQQVAGYNEGEKATICTKPELYRKIDAAVKELKKADRLAKLPALVDEARESIKKTKKLGAREVAHLFACTMSDSYQRAFLGDAAIKRLGAKIPAPIVAASRHGEGEIEQLGKLECEDHVVLWRVLADSHLSCLLSEEWLDDETPDFDQAPDSPLALFLKFLLGCDDLDLLEETKAGQKQLMATVEAQEWYQRALAEIEGREYVAPAAKPAAPAASKPAKKGKK